MANRLNIDLLPTWTDRSRDHPQGPPTYIRHASSDPGALQVSWASYSRPGPPPQMTDGGLTQLATRLATSPGARIESSTVGKSAWGRFACVVAHAPDRRMQVWVINNGPDNVLVTHSYSGSGQPDASELSEAEQIAMSIRVTEGG